MKPRWTVRAIAVCIALIMGGVSALGTLEFAYVFIPLAALTAGLTVNCSAAGYTMILNMAPLRYGGERRGKWLRGMVLYSVGAMASTATLGGVLGYLGAMLPPSLTPDANGLLILGSLAAVHALREPHVVPVPMPQSLRDLREKWRDRFFLSLVRHPLGTLIGQASGTLVPDALVQVSAMAAVLYGSPIFGAILFGMFGASRVGMLWLLVSRGRTEADVHRSFEFVGVTEPMLRLLSGCFLAAVGGYSILTWFIGGG